MNELLIETGIQLARPARRAVTRKKRPRSKETPIVKAILDALKARRIWAFRVNSGGKSIPATKKSKRSFIKGAPAGTPDILVVLPGGRLGGLEVKSATGVQLPSQRVWEAKAQLHGVKYGLVRSAKEALETVQRWIGGVA